LKPGQRNVSIVVSHLRTIGNKAIVLSKDEKRGKFQPKDDEYMIGYSAESKAFGSQVPKLLLKRAM